jgi:protein-tyrosine-phosphatase
MDHEPLRILFLCTGNAARSQMAEALLRQLSGGRAEVFSAGNLPQPEVHPVARRTLEEQFGIDTADLFPKSVDRFIGQTFDFIITVCDKVAERCPVFPEDPERIHWSFEDPATIADVDDQRRAFANVANGLAARLRIWMSLPDIQRRIEQ